MKSKIFYGLELDEIILESMLNDVRNNAKYKGFKYYHRPIKRITLAIGVLFGKCMCVHFKTIRERK